MSETAKNAADAGSRVLEEAVEAVSDRLEFPSASEAGVTARGNEEEPTSVESAETMEHTAGTVGFTGEIVGRVVKLEDLDKEPEEDTFAGYEQLKELIEQTLTDVSEHEIVKGRIVTVGDKDVVIDIGFKSDGIVPKSEFSRELEAGDEVEVYLERIEDYHGQLILSKTKADTVQRWMRVEDAFENEKVLEGVIVRRIKGGMIVELFDGMEAFLPGSQIDVRPVRDFDAYLEKRMEFKIVKLNPANENIVVSHKALVEKELEAQRDSILSTMEAGQILEGVVKNITDFGVFIGPRRRGRLAAHHGPFLGPRLAPVRTGRPGPEDERGGAGLRQGTGSASRSASSSFSPTRGTTSARSTPSATRSRARWFRSPITAPLSSWRKVSKDSSTSRR